MKVKELIEILVNCEQEAEICSMYDSLRGCTSFDFLVKMKNEYPNGYVLVDVSGHKVLTEFPHDFKYEIIYKYQ